LQEPNPLVPVGSEFTLTIFADDSNIMGLSISSPALAEGLELVQVRTSTRYRQRAWFSAFEYTFRALRAGLFELGPYRISSSTEAASTGSIQVRALSASTYANQGLSAEWMDYPALLQVGVPETISLFVSGTSLPHTGASRYTPPLPKNAILEALPLMEGEAGLVYTFRLIALGGTEVVIGGGTLNLQGAGAVEVPGISIPLAP
jgi:hypothetical protein